jgi:plastocyanin
MKEARMKAPLIAIALTGTLLTACGGGADSGGTSPVAADQSDASAATSTVTMTDNAYSPAEPVVQSGELQLVNDGESPHTFTVDGQGVNIEVDAGSSARATIDLEPGTYTVFCEFHRAQGMETTLTVI